MGTVVMFVACVVAVLIARVIKDSVYSAGRGDERGVRIVSFDGGRSTGTAGRPAARRRAFVEDLSFGDPTARKLEAALQGGDWSSVHRHLEGVRDWGKREFLVEALSAYEVFQGREALLDQWCRSKPDSALGFLLRGRWRINAAWKARSGGVASQVTQKGWELFFSLLTLAEEDLAKAAELDRADPTAHALRVITARGLQLGADEARARFTAATELDPHHRLAHAMLLQQLCKKWSGSHEAMFQLAHDALAKAPAGSVLGGLVPQAHAERWLYAVGMADSAADDPEWFGKGDRYFQDPAVCEDLVKAWDRSLGSPWFRDSETAVPARNYFAFCFHLAGDQDRARAALEPLGLEKVLSIPWSWLGKGEPDAAVNHARAACGLPPL
ncbi:MAG: hypothetical protein AB7N76_22075 [Planctomycetota bacterium]